MQTIPITDAEIDRLEEMLASDLFRSEAMTLDILQGFLCAVISGPAPIPPEVWLPLALGEAPDWESEAQAAEARGLVMKFHDSIASALEKEEEFDLILYGVEDDPEKLDYVAWCEGYVYGAQIGGANWFEIAGEYAPDLSEKMEAFFLLTGMLKEDAIKHKEPWLTPKEEERALAQAEEDFPSAIRDIHRFWRVRRAAPVTVRREARKVGRNDACPCGSGKKFKQCCGKEHP